MSGWLVVNQNVQETDRTRQQVNARGLSCETAHDWRTAEQRLHGNQFDVIVVDEAMDTLDQQSVLDHIASEPAAHDSKIVLIGNGECNEQDSSIRMIRSESEMLANIDELLAQITSS